MVSNGNGSWRALGYSIGFFLSFYFPFVSPINCPEPLEDEGPSHSGWTIYPKIISH